MFMTVQGNFNSDKEEFVVNVVDVDGDGDGE